MIPLRLTLRNFMSYRDAAPTLELEGFHIVCLCGENGHGKSALLDAVTWALWGAVRGMVTGSRSLRTEELVHAGQAEMEVALEFLAGETRYRVVRKYGRASHGPAAGGLLDLQVENGPSWRSISESTMPATQRSLNRILQMDYETFVNSAFLLQGQTDRFTRAEPSRRKEILCDILGLSRYDELARESRDQARDLRVRADAAAADARRLSEELATRPQVELDLGLAQTAVRTLHPKVDATAKLKEVVSLRLALLDQRAPEQSRLQREVGTKQSTLQDFERRSRRLQEQRASYENILLNKDAVLKEKAQYQDGIKQLQTLDSLALRYQTLQNDLHTQQRTIEVAKTRLEGEMKAAERKVAEVSVKAAQGSTLQAQLVETRDRLKALDTEESSVLERHQAWQTAQVETRRLEAETRAITEEGKQVRARLDILLAEPNPMCPVCKTPLGVDGRKHIEQEMETTIQALRQRFSDGQKAFKETNARAEALAKELDALTRDVRRRRESTTREEGRIAQTLAESVLASKELMTTRQVVDHVHTTITQGSYAQEARAALEHVQAELGALGYDPAAHRELQQACAVLAGVPEKARSLREAEQHLPEVQHDLALATQQIADAQQSLKGDEDALRHLAEELLIRPQIEAELARATQAHVSLQQQHQSAQAQFVRCETRLADLDTKKQQHAELSARTGALQTERDTYEVLAEAFGKNGLQAMLIDEALPEIEEDANQLLSRLTDGRMHLKLETQRNTKRGAAQETLDLLVADELSTRPYDLFSGGEGFRINFALRVALARVLARRAGAPLRTLLIDEGFGTQDVAGRERLVSAIRAIQDDFALIIVITHLEDLKEAFPVRIEIEKTSEAGSSFRVVA
ncbi:MAG: SMC family ATPase [Dehalococcoidia bacterium]|nr:SMC family ATPase [Dehalococcoidia bacterium]